MLGRDGGHAWQGVCMAWGMHGKGECVAKRVVRSKWGGGCVAGETATAADGMHTTGIHSCFIVY